MASEQYDERVAAVTNYVRANLAGNLSLSDLAAVAHFSPYHFHRIFGAVTGETVGEFVRRARLERAVYLMKSSPSKSLASIAVASGFRTHSDFSRVFRSVYGIAPSDWDRVRRLVETEVEPDPQRDGPGRFGPLPATPELTVRTRDSEIVVYLRVRDPWQGSSLLDGYEELTSCLLDLAFDWAAAPMIGMSWDSYDATEIGKVTFDIGFGATTALDVTGTPLETVDLPAMRSVEAHSDGPLIQVAQTWDFLYLDWLPSSGYEPADLPAIKRFRRRPDETGWEHWDVDCCIALVNLTP